MVNNILTNTQSLNSPHHHALDTALNGLQLVLPATFLHPLNRILALPLPFPFPGIPLIFLNLANALPKKRPHRFLIPIRLHLRARYMRLVLLLLSERALALSFLVLVLDAID